MDELSFSSSQIEAFAELLNGRYAAPRKERSFQVEISDQDEITLLRVILQNQDQSYYYPIEARIDRAKEELTAKAAGAFLVDYIDGYLEEFFAAEDESLFLPIDWHSRSYEACDFQIRGQIQNLSLERAADELLAQSAH